MSGGIAAHAPPSINSVHALRRFTTHALVACYSRTSRCLGSTPTRRLSTRRVHAGRALGATQPKPAAQADELV